MKTKKLLFILNPRAGRNKPHGPLFDALAISLRRGLPHPDPRDLRPRRRGRYRRPGGRRIRSGGGSRRRRHPQRGDLRPDAAGCPAAPGLSPPGHHQRLRLQPPDSPGPRRPPRRTSSQNRMRELDIGRWNERSFIYVASFGAFTRSSYAASQAAKNALGHFAYILEGMKDLNTLRPYHIRLTADGGGAGRGLPVRRRVQLHLHRRADEAGPGAGGAG